MKPWKTWKKVRLGNFRNLQEMERKFHQSNAAIDDHARDLISWTCFSGLFVGEVDLVRITADDVDLIPGAKAEVIIQHALEQGLRPCPPDVAPELRLQYQDQPKGEYLYVANLTVLNMRGTEQFYLVRDDDEPNLLWLGAEYGRDEDPDEEMYDFRGVWVFAKPKGIISP